MIGEVFAGTKVGRTSGSDVTIYKSLGAVVQDLVAGWYVYQQAQALGRGTDARF